VLAARWKLLDALLYEFLDAYLFNSMLSPSRSKNSWDKSFTSTLLFTLNEGSGWRTSHLSISLNIMLLTLILLYPVFPNVASLDSLFDSSIKLRTPTRMRHTYSIFIAELTKEFKLSSDRSFPVFLSWIPNSYFTPFHTKGSKSLVATIASPTNGYEISTYKS